MENPPAPERRKTRHVTLPADFRRILSQPPSLCLPQKSSDPPEPANVPRDFLKALALIQGVAGIVVGQAIEVDVTTSQAFQMLDHAAQHLAAQPAALKPPAHRHHIAEST